MEAFHQRNGRDGPYRLRAPSYSERLLFAKFELGIPPEDAEMQLAEIPSPLIDSGSCFDKMTGLWRYEFGLPLTVGGSHVWGAHMVPVEHLARA